MLALCLGYRTAHNLGPGWKSVNGKRPPKEVSRAVTLVPIRETVG